MDNAAGSFPKPPELGRAMAESLSHFGANPGRGNYALTRRTAAMVERTRLRLSRFVGAAIPERMIFTAGRYHEFEYGGPGRACAGQPCRRIFYGTQRADASFGSAGRRRINPAQRGAGGRFWLYYGSPGRTGTDAEDPADRRKPCYPMFAAASSPLPRSARWPKRKKYLFWWMRRKVPACCPWMWGKCIFPCWP